MSQVLNREGAGRAAVGGRSGVGSYTSPDDGALCCFAKAVADDCFSIAGYTCRKRAAPRCLPLPKRQSKRGSAPPGKIAAGRVASRPTLGFHHVGWVTVRSPS